MGYSGTRSGLLTRLPSPSDGLSFQSAGGWREEPSARECAGGERCGKILDCFPVLPPLPATIRFNLKQQFRHGPAVVDRNRYQRPLAKLRTISSDQARINIHSADNDHVIGASDDATLEREVAALPHRQMPRSLGLTRSPVR
jgi:hypothetical protein